MTITTGSRAGGSLRALVDRADRACKGVDVEVFFPRSAISAAVEYAKGYCRCCPIISECLNYAIDNDLDGIWGGTTAAERAEKIGTAAMSSTGRRAG